MKVWIGQIDHGFGTDTDKGYISLNIYFAGCSKEPKCDGCHNPDLWDRKRYFPYELERVVEEIDDNIGFAGAIVFMGGEPLDQEEALIELAIAARERGMVRYLYTGREIEEVSQTLKDIINVIIAGPYIPSMANSLGAWPASKNQTIYRKEDGE